MPRRKINRLDHSRAETCLLKTPSGAVSYTLLKSSRRRTMEISVSEEERVRVVVPSYVSRKAVEGFIRERSAWIINSLQAMHRANQFTCHRDYEIGQEFLFLGKSYPVYIEEGARKQTRVVFDKQGWSIFIPSGLTEAQRRQKVKTALVQWYRREAREILGTRVFHNVRLMGLEPMTVSVRTQKQIWGSCHCGEKHITLNWLLVLAPLHVIDYVIVHELAHLTHPNHSRRFWNKVESFLPDYKERQDWLKNHRLEMKLP